jgi:histidinol-phosphate aminotransferase
MPGFRPDLQILKPYVPGRSVAEVKKLWGIDSALKMNSNENPLGASPKVAEAILKNMTQISEYPAGDAAELRVVLAEFLKLKSENLLIGNGSDEIIVMICAAYLKVGQNVLSSQPTFSEYRFGTLLAGAEYRFVPMQNFDHDDQALLNHIDNQTAIVFLCSPNNPTGLDLGAGRIKNFLEKIPSQVLVVLDQAYVEFCTQNTGQSTLALLEQYPNLLLLRTFSKAFGLAGLRVGYAIGHPQVINDLSRVKQPFNVGVLAQISAVAALSDKEHLQETLSLVQTGRDYLAKECAELGYRVLPSDANFIAVHIGPKAKSMVDALEKSGVIIRWLNSFEMPEWVRISVGTFEQNQKLIQLIKNTRSSL